MSISRLRWEQNNFLSVNGAIKLPCGRGHKKSLPPTPFLKSIYNYSLCIPSSDRDVKPQITPQAYSSGGLHDCCSIHVNALGKHRGNAVFEREVLSLRHRRIKNENVATNGNLGSKNRDTQEKYQAQSPEDFWKVKMGKSFWLYQKTRGHSAETSRNGSEAGWVVIAVLCNFFCLPRNVVTKKLSSVHICLWGKF